jgi:hypothetical protein
MRIDLDHPASEVIVERKVGLVSMNKQMKYLADYAISQRAFAISIGPDNIPLNQTLPTRRLYQVQQLELYRSNLVQNPVLRPAGPFPFPFLVLGGLPSKAGLESKHPDRAQLDLLVPQLALALAVVLLPRAFLDFAVLLQHHLLVRYYPVGISLVTGSEMGRMDRWSMELGNGVDWSRGSGNPPRLLSCQHDSHMSLVHNLRSFRMRRSMAIQMKSRSCNFGSSAKTPSHIRRAESKGSSLVKIRRSQRLLVSLAQILKKSVTHMAQI